MFLARYIRFLPAFLRVGFPASLVAFYDMHGGRTVDLILCSPFQGPGIHTGAVTNQKQNKLKVSPDNSDKSKVARYALHFVPLLFIPVLGLHFACSIRPLDLCYVIFELFQFFIVSRLAPGQRG